MRKKIDREAIEEALEETEYLFVNGVTFRPDAVNAMEMKNGKVRLYLSSGHTVDIPLEKGQDMTYVTDLVCPSESRIPDEWESEKVDL